MSVYFVLLLLFMFLKLWLFLVTGWASFFLVCNLPKVFYWYPFSNATRLKKILSFPHSWFFKGI